MATDTSSGFSGFSLLHRAVHDLRPDVVEHLIRTGSKDQLLELDPLGRTPLWYALHRTIDCFQNESEQDKLKIVLMLILAEPSALRMYYPIKGVEGKKEHLESLLFVLYRERTYSCYPRDSPTILNVAIKAVGLDWISPDEIPYWIEASVDRREGGILDRLLQFDAIRHCNLGEHLPKWILNSIRTRQLPELNRFLDFAIEIHLDIASQLSKWIAAAIYTMEPPILDRLLSMIDLIDEELEMEIPSWIKTALQTKDLVIIDRILNLEATSECDLSGYIRKWAAEAIQGGYLEIVKRILPNHFDHLFDKHGKSLLELVPSENSDLFEYLLRTQTWPLDTIAKVMLEDYVLDDDEYFSSSADESDDEFKDDPVLPMSRFVAYAKHEDFQPFLTCLEYVNPILASAVQAIYRIQLQREIACNLLPHTFTRKPHERTIDSSPSGYRQRFLVIMETIIKYVGLESFWASLKSYFHQLIHAAISDYQFDHALFLIWLETASTGDLLDSRRANESILLKVFQSESSWDPGYIGREMRKQALILPARLEINPDLIVRQRALILRTIDPTLDIPDTNDGIVAYCLNYELTEEQRLTIRHSVYFARSLTERLLYFV